MDGSDYCAFMTIPVVFSGYEENENGFYTVYGNLFHEIIKREP